jgi:hypothetical protein
MCKSGRGAVLGSPAAPAINAAMRAIAVLMT